MGDDIELPCRLVDVAHHVLGGYHAHRNPVVTLAHQVLEDLLLLLDLSRIGLLQIDLDSFFRLGALEAFFGDLPELAGVVGHKGELERRAFGDFEDRPRGGPFALGCRSKEEEEKEQKDHGKTSDQLHHETS